MTAVQALNMSSAWNTVIAACPINNIGPLRGKNNFSGMSKTIKFPLNLASGACKLVFISTADSSKG